MQSAKQSINFCIQCGPTAERVLIREGHRGSVETGSFVRCYAIAPSVCHEGPFIPRTSDIEIDYDNAVRAWNNESK